MSQPIGFEGVTPPPDGQEKTAGISEIELSDASHNEKQPLHKESPARPIKDDKDKDDQYFEDGIRKIDYVIAYKKENKEGEDETKRTNRRKEYIE
ncbi:hypothetical protein, partial [Salmonella sp. s55004]|uniref:hypothetical protein n=1 Tax=Salmonella sp. s55004 TaxID=3159675 RepID=UPI00398189F4